MGTVFYIVVLVMALLPQIAFSALYWRWIPAWTKNAYGRLAQLESWSQTYLLLVLLFNLSFSSYLSLDTKRAILATSIVPFIILSGLRIYLLKRAFDSSKEEGEDEK